ncbi:hypothetical protein HPB52_022768 [Rhipicephalus sanguineus]|uniref:Uncharacterized protein n=1 Tax=Rhipicephalus sanguineus TaxID=34632 RepID=A0A9D4SZB9_RHISA|nr:hypothetical protein HPB52_022768 [Rhipicephalus sanguineus]
MLSQTRLLRFPPLEEIQRRCLLRKVTRGLTAPERRALARFIFREQCALPPRPGAKTPDIDMQALSPHEVILPDRAANQVSSDTDVASGLQRGFTLQPDAPELVSRTKRNSLSPCQAFRQSPAAAPPSRGSAPGGAERSNVPEP